MVVVPNRLLRESFVTVLLRTPHTLVLRKELSRPLEGRRSYVSKPVLVTVVAGEQRIQNDEGVSLTVQAGETAVIRRGLYTTTDLSSDAGSFRAFLVFFDGHGAEALPQSDSLQLIQPLSARYAFGLTFATPSPVAYFWQALAAWQRAVPSAGASLQRIKVEEFFALLSTSKSATSIAQCISQAQPSARSLRSFMESHYDKPLTVADYAYLTGRSESTFRREFKRKFGVAPRQWIIHRRLERGRELLRSPKAEVTQIAYNVGYESVSHFISEYKKQYGHTPGQQPASGTLPLK